ncbi:hepatic and glial cell adhesion molecule-like [Heptranchias perlo]|uniref:hepatic and glial cell adhesion molecule-like n=1 Tax=Heptranchias perlo TaxID=212740 RepID=UPI00355AAA70
MSERTMYGRINPFKFTNIFLFISYFISLSASGSRVTVRVDQSEVNGTVNQSVLLPVSYSYSTLTLKYSILTIKWFLFPSDTPCATLTRLNCSLTPDKSGYNCSDHQQDGPAYKHRVHIYPENGSLLLRDLQSNDSGVYVISVSRGGETASEGNVTLTVYPETASEYSTTPSVSGSAENSTTGPDKWENTLYINVSTAVCLLIIIITCLCLLVIRTHRGRHPPRDSVVTETPSAQPEGTRQALAEGQELVINGEVTYSYLHWSGPINTPAPEPDTSEAPPMNIYAFVQKVERK